MVYLEQEGCDVESQDKGDDETIESFRLMQIHTKSPLQGVGVGATSSKDRLSLPMRK
jgi:hypothetical protein